MLHAAGKAAAPQPPAAGAPPAADDARSGKTSALFEPLEFAGLRLKNRLVMAPMGSCQSDDEGYVTDQTVAYYRRRAAGRRRHDHRRGGARLARLSHGHEPRLHGAEFVPGMRRVVDAISEHGVTAGIQLMHPGRQVTSGPVVAPVAGPVNSAAPMPHALTVAEIRRHRRAVRAHGAARAGGGLRVRRGARRARLPAVRLPLADREPARRRATAAAREARCASRSRSRGRSSRRPTSRCSGGSAPRSDVEGGYTVDDQVAGRAAGSSERASRASRLRRHLALARTSRSRRCSCRAATCSPYAARDQGRRSAIPVIAVGRLDDPELAERARPTGAADLVLLGRGLLADPDWPRKLEQGARGEIRPCIACNACVDLVGPGSRCRCAVNPELGRESTWKRRARRGAAARAGRRRRARRAWRRRGSRGCAATRSRSGSATTRSAASSTSPRARRARARCCASATTRRATARASSASRSTPGVEVTADVDRARGPRRRRRRHRRRTRCIPPIPGIDGATCSTRRSSSTGASRSSPASASRSSAAARPAARPPSCCSGAARSRRSSRCSPRSAQGIERSRAATSCARCAATASRS